MLLSTERLRTALTLLLIQAHKWHDLANEARQQLANHEGLEHCRYPQRLCRSQPRRLSVVCGEPQGDDLDA